MRDKHHSDHCMDDKIRKNIGAMRISVEHIVPLNMYLWIWRQVRNTIDEHTWWQLSDPIEDNMDTDASSIL